MVSPFLPLILNNRVIFEHLDQAELVAMWVGLTDSYGSVSVPTERL